MHTILSSATKTVRIGDDQPFAIIGERINPTGRKIFQLQLRNGDLSRVEIDVKEQVAGGAMLLDVNMGAPLADEAALMRQAVTLIQESLPVFPRHDRRNRPASRRNSIRAAAPQERQNQE